MEVNAKTQTTILSSSNRLSCISDSVVVADWADDDDTKRCSIIQYRPTESLHLFFTPTFCPHY
eukprot:scaffold18835_cov67-Skeletonema_dohrnii-CCMP3373.AAC.1